MLSTILTLIVGRLTYSYHYESSLYRYVCDNNGALICSALQISLLNDYLRLSLLNLVDGSVNAIQHRQFSIPVP